MNLVTDRTQSDVFLGTEKGRYGAADLNRVETAVKELFGIAKALDVVYEPVVKTDWGFPGGFSYDQWPTKGQMERYLNNVSRLCAAVEIAADLPLSMEHLTWEGANQIEQALLLVYTRIQNILQAFRFSGEFFAGEENRL